MEQKELESRLKEMQDRVMGAGHEQIIDETKKQEAILRKTAAELEKKAVNSLLTSLLPLSFSALHLFSSLTISTVRREKRQFTLLIFSLIYLLLLATLFASPVSPILFPPIISSPTHPLLTHSLSHFLTSLSHFLFLTFSLSLSYFLFLTFSFLLSLSYFLFLTFSLISTVRGENAEETIGRSTRNPRIQRRKIFLAATGG
jgi:hypothetical protein